MAEGDEKNFANLHYPGIFADPSEGKFPIHLDAQWRFEQQMACIGEDAQKHLFHRSAFLQPASPLSICVAKKLFAMGFGRVGILGEQPLLGAHGLARPSSEEKGGTLAHFSKWTKAEAPWAVFEAFRETSIDRQAADMARGFDCVIACDSDPKSLGASIELARQENLPAIVALVSGRQGWCASLPLHSVCEDCLVAPVSQSVGAPVFYPLLELAATWIATFAVDVALGHQPRGAFIESFDAKTSPWMRETRELRPRPGCKKCAAKT